MRKENFENTTALKYSFVNPDPDKKEEKNRKIVKPLLWFASIVQQIPVSELGIHLSDPVPVAVGRLIFLID